MLIAHINQINDSFLRFHNILNIILCENELLLYSYVSKCRVLILKGDTATKILTGTQFLHEICCMNVVIIYSTNIDIANNLIKSYNELNNIVDIKLKELEFTKDTWKDTKVTTQHNLDELLEFNIGEFFDNNTNYPQKYNNIKELSPNVQQDLYNCVIPDKAKTKNNRLRKEHTKELIDLNEKECFLLCNDYYKINYTKANYNVELTNDFLPNINADAYVNTANEALQGGGGTDLLIHTYAGESLKEETSKLPNVIEGQYYYGVKCLTGDSKITSGHNLKAKYIIHTVTPYLDTNGKTNKQMHINCYKSILKYIDQDNIKSIVIGPLSTGYYGYPMLEATILGFKVISEFLKEKNDSDIKIIFWIHNETQYKMYKYLMPYFF